MTTSTPSSSDPLSNGQARAVQLLNSAKSFLLTGHQRPDGDCIGAQAALARILQARGATVHILNPDPPESRYHYLSEELDYGVQDVALELPKHEVSVLLDCSELSRCGELGPRLAAASSKKLVIDHHPHEGDEWWDESFRDITASATGALVFRLAALLDLPLDDVARKGVFTSIVTDTGWFKYSNADPECLRIAADLIEQGLQPAEMYSAIYQDKAAEHPLLLARILERLTYHAQGRLGVINLPLSLGLDNGSVDSEDALDLVRAVAQVEVVLFLREVEPERWKLSARSKTDFDVNRLARSFGGGGHAKAAGATLEGNYASLLNSIVATAEERLLNPSAAAAESGGVSP